MKLRFPVLHSPNSSESKPAEANGDAGRNFASSRSRNFPTLTEAEVVPQPQGELGAESTDTFGAFAACKQGTGCDGCRHRPREIQEAAREEALLVPPEAASWLHTLEDYEGYWLVEWERADGAFPIHLIVGEGEVFYGVARQCGVWTDAVFANGFPELCDAYRDYCARRTGDSDCIAMQDLLIDLDAFPVDDTARAAFLEHMARMLAPGTKGRGKRWRLDDQLFEEHRFLSFEPVELLAAIGRQVCPVGGLESQLCELNIEPEEGWLFSLEGTECGPLIFSSQPLRDSIGRIEEIAAIADSMLAVAALTPAVEQSVIPSISVVADHVWMCLASGSSVVVTKHPLLHLGRLCHMIEKLQPA